MNVNKQFTKYFLSSETISLYFSIIISISRGDDLHYSQKKKLIDFFTHKYKPILQLPILDENNMIKIPQTTFNSTLFHKYTLKNTISVMAGRG